MTEPDDIKTFRAKKELKKRLAARKWELQAFSGDEPIRMRLYCYDPVDSGALFLAGLTRDDIERLKAFPADMAAVVDAVRVKFLAYAEASSAQLKLRTSELGFVLGLYAVRTQSFQQALTPVNNLTPHFIVLLYPDSRRNAATLRPFCIVSEKDSLEPDEVKAMAAPIVARDRQVNPGYFGSADVIRFPVA